MRYYNETGNIKPASRHLVVTWMLQAWALLDKEFLRLFKSCALPSKNDGNEDNIIHCFKSRQPFSGGAFLLKDQVNILNNDDIVNCNTFEVTDSDVHEENTETNIIDEKNEEYNFIDIE